MKNFKFLQTDFYQLSMGFAYIFEGLNKETSGFEGFVRNIKNTVNPNLNFYVFDGENEINEYIATIREELKDPELIETFIKLVEPKITAPNKDELIDQFRKKWQTIDTDFEYSVVPNGSFVFPLVPVFQYKGDKLIGQMMETHITNIYNGRTGLATIKYLRENGMTHFVSDEEFIFLENLMNDDTEALAAYAKILEESAKDFRNSTDKMLLEAAFRRAPSLKTANLASEIALANGWNSTSNVSVALSGKYPIASVGGTMAHSWVMSFQTEEEAFKVWDKIFPGTSILIDTYDVINATKLVKKLIDNNEITKPQDLRIDSDPIEDYVDVINKTFDNKINSYISGDVTIDKLKHFEFVKMPFSKTMIGTKYCYASMIVEKLNCGFVYKLVQFKKDGKFIKPEKKANGKLNYSGLKNCIFDEATNTIIVDCINSNNEIGFRNFDKILPTTTVKFITPLPENPVLQGRDVEARNQIV